MLAGLLIAVLSACGKQDGTESAADNGTESSVLAENSETAEQTKISWVEKRRRTYHGQRKDTGSGGYCHDRGYFLPL